MKYEDMVQAVQHLAVVESQTLLALNADRHGLSVQLGRWVKRGRLIQLRRGVYLLPKYLRKNEPSRAYLANLLTRPSFVSFEYALALHGLIPESVHLVQSVTTGRTCTVHTENGTYGYRHIRRDRFFGFSEMSLQESPALVATPERALLDLAYFSKDMDVGQIEALRLQDLDRIDLERLFDTAGRFKSREIERVARRYAEHIERERSEWNEL